MPKMLFLFCFLTDDPTMVEYPIIRYPCMLFLAPFEVLLVIFSFFLAAARNLVISFIVCVGLLPRKSYIIIMLVMDVFQL